MPSLEGTRQSASSGAQPGSGRSITSISSARGNATASRMWPTVASESTMTGVRKRSARLKASTVKEKHSATELGTWYREEHLPSLLAGSPVASVLAFSPLPLLGDAPSDVPRSGSVERLLLLCFLDEEPTASWERLFAHEGKVVGDAGKGRLVWASPFVSTVPGTDTYTDQLWSER